MRLAATGVIIVAVFAACSTGETNRTADDSALPRTDSARLVSSPTGFAAPEAVRYDPDQDLYFVSNWGRGDAGATDNNGFISRVTPDGTIAQARFIAGGAGGAMLHSPRGMTIVGDTLWVVDVDAVRGFHRRTGAQLATASFAHYKLGFLNDIAAAPDGLYITDTGTNHIYKIADAGVSVALHDSTLGNPNGITWDSRNRRFVVVPWGGGSVIRAWSGKGRTLTKIGGSGGKKFDGVEILSGDRVLVASQGDSSLHLFTGGTGRPIIRTGGAPADIAVDTRRNRVAVPFVALNMVEIWQLPSER